jgi:hypothetical protein
MDDLFDQEPILHRNPLPGTVAPSSDMYIPGEVMNNIVDYIDASNDPVVYRLECLEKHAQALHPLLDTNTKLMINVCKNSNVLLQLVKCPKCKFLGIPSNQLAAGSCSSCAFGPFDSDTDELTETQKRIRKRAYNSYLMEMAKQMEQNRNLNIFDPVLDRFIPTHMTLPVNLLILCATHLGENQSRNEMIYH